MRHLSEWQRLMNEKSKTVQQAMKSYIFILIGLMFVGSVGVGCQECSQLPENFSYSNKLLYVEDIDGKNGLFNYNFGDIVCFDPVKKVKYYLTCDRYYNRFPSISSDRKYIVFESKRGDYSSINDLSTPSKLYVLALPSLKIRPLSHFITIPKDLYDINLSTPELSHTKNKLVFLGDCVFDCDFTTLNAYIYDPEKKDYFLAEDSLMDVLELDWSEDDAYIFYSFFYKSRKTDQFGQAISILNITSGKNVVIYDHKWFFEPGYIVNNGLLYSRSRINMETDKGESQVFLYDIAKKNHKKLAEFKELYIYKIVYGRTRDECYFIAGNYIDNKEFVDIYHYSLNKQKLVKLTDDGYEKDDLIYIK